MKCLTSGAYSGTANLAGESAVRLMDKDWACLEWKVIRTTFIGWPFIYSGGYRVSSGAKSARWYRKHKWLHRFCYAVSECSEHSVAISEDSWSEDGHHVTHAILVDDSLSWLVEAYDRKMWSAPSYRVFDLNRKELLAFPRNNWRPYSLFGQVLVCEPNDRGEIQIFEHGGVAGDGWPVELLIGIDLFKEPFDESI